MFAERRGLLKAIVFAGLVIPATFLLLRCAGSPPPPLTPPTDNTSSSEIAEALISGAVQATVSAGAGTQASYKLNRAPRATGNFSLLKEIIGNLTLVPKANAQRVAVGQCPLLSAPNSAATWPGTTCTLNGTTQMVVALPVCNFPSVANTVTWSGNEVFTKTGGPTALSCTAMPTFANGDTVVRTFSTPTSRMTSNNLLVLIDTSSDILGNNPPVTTTGELITYSGATARTIQINGIHVEGAINNYVVWNYVASSTAMNVDSSGNVSAGIVQIQNLANGRVASSTVTTPLTFTAGCCMATGGTITTTFSDGSASETLNMTGSCGAATLNGTATTLNHCW